MPMVFPSPMHEPPMTPMTRFMLEVSIHMRLYIYLITSFLSTVYSTDDIIHNVVNIWFFFVATTLSFHSGDSSTWFIWLLDASSNCSSSLPSSFFCLSCHASVTIQRYVSSHTIVGSHTRESGNRTTATVCLLVIIQLLFV